ncbi:MATH domain and coiled-coil domain-containing protein At3g58410-like [Rhododendron vialii]|uniref:MATH domain and coiled-coil domain-containing protein At3g58410-like n=1 Tax=Rhododendron vialii TaxID=182163 RepID=UPI002660453F|nr:MATH domain and coiled-coil domain-containing protein At3g58410-like [Rhododendron vialii]
MEDKSCHPDPVPNDNGNFEISRSLRNIPPAHYLLRIESFSLLSQMMLDAEVQNYESDVFEASGYKWKLSLYPTGDEESKGEGHISLYLVITETNDLPLGWEVYVNFKLFVFDHIQDKYMTVQDANGKVRRFHAMKTEWGFPQLLPLSTFTEAANGYLIRDTSVFGAKVFVVNSTGRGERLNIMKERSNTHTWKIDKFSSRHEKCFSSDVFTLADRKWKIRLYPKGDSSKKDKFLSLFLELDDPETFPFERKTYANYKLRIRNQYNSNHEECGGSRCFCAPCFSRGSSAFLPLTDLNDASKGFLVHDTLIVEAKVTASSTVKNLS